MPNLIASFLYDQKPFYMMTSGMPDISWVKIPKKIWSTVGRKYKDVSFYCLSERVQPADGLDRFG